MPPDVYMKIDKNMVTGNQKNTMETSFFYLSSVAIFAPAYAAVEGRAALPQGNDR